MRKETQHKSYRCSWIVITGRSSLRPEVCEELLANERDNFRVLYEAVTELGGVPLMLRAADMSNTIPDEKVSVHAKPICAFSDCPGLGWSVVAMN